MKYLNTLFFVAGLLALGLLIHAFGPLRIATAMVESWPALALVTSIQAVSLILSYISWLLLVPRAVRPPFSSALPGHMVGYALNRLLPTGNMGELAKFNLLRALVPIRELTASLLTNTIVGVMVGICFAIAGAIALLTLLEIPRALGLTMLAVSLLFFAITFVVLILLRLGLFFRLLRFLRRFRLLSGLTRFEEKTKALDDAIQQVATLGRNDTLKALLFFVAGRLTVIAMNACMVAFLIPSYSPGNALLLGFVLASAGQLIQWSLLLLPAGIGAVEGGAALLTHALGVGGEIGVSVALGLRIVSMSFSGACLMAYFLATGKTRAELDFIMTQPPDAHSAKECVPKTQEVS